MTTKIRLLTDDDFVLAGRTFTRGSKGSTLDLNDEEFQSVEVQHALEELEIEIVKDSSSPKVED
jgi:hypothetical protein